MDGVMLINYVRRRWPPIHLILVSGKALVEAAQLPPGARFFPKPYRGPQIVDVMRTMLAAQ
jgi:hypothetical protein